MNNSLEKKKEIYLTFDMDWACDEVLDEFSKLMGDLHVAYTINVTHQTKVLDGFRNSEQVELGIHPNFNFLLCGQSQDSTNGNNYSDVIDNLLTIVPEAVTARSHSLTDSTMISTALYEKGIKYNLNRFIQHPHNTAVSDYKDYTGLYKIPFCFEDDVWFGYMKDIRVEDFFSEDVTIPLVFNFHPIHIFLNTEEAETYNRIRPFYKGGEDNFDRMRKMVNKERYGSKDWLMDIVQYGKANGYRFLKISEGDWV